MGYRDFLGGTATQLSDISKEELESGSLNCKQGNDGYYHFSDPAIKLKKANSPKQILQSFTLSITDSVYPFVTFAGK